MSCPQQNCVFLQIRIFWGTACSLLLCRSKSLRPDVEPNNNNLRPNTNQWRHSRRTWGISSGADQVLKIRQKITHNLYRAHNILKAAPFCDGNCQSNVKTLPHISGEAILSHTSSLCIDCSDGKWSARSSSNVFPSWTLPWFPSSATYIWIEVHFTLCKPTESRFLSENTP